MTGTAADKGAPQQAIPAVRFRLTSILHPGRASAMLYLPAGFAFAIGVVATIYFCTSMSDVMEMPGGWTMSMMWMHMPDESPLMSALTFMLMWLAMMVAMMLPSTLPALLHYHRSLKEQGRGDADASTALAACGYFAVWTGVGAPVYIAGTLLATAAMESPSLSAAVPFLTGAALVVAGLMQFSPWKRRGLGNCRTSGLCALPGAGFLLRSGWSHGVRQGVSCVTCCAGPMMVLLAVGLMNPLAMSGVAVVIAAEKLLTKPQFIIRAAGASAVVAGGVVLAGLLA